MLVRMFIFLINDWLSWTHIVNLFFKWIDDRKLMCSGTSKLGHSPL